MEGYFQLRLKRKDLEDVSDDFSDFSLTSPARKIRRLDAELPPIIEEEEPDIPIEFEDSLPDYGSASTGGIKIDELPDEPINEERAIVLFNPNNTTPLLQSPSNFSVSINPSILSGLKNQVLWSNQSNPWRLMDKETAEDNDTASRNGCMAVVPWVPNQLPLAPGPQLPPHTDNPEMMDAQETEEATMEVEETNTINQINANESEQFHEWQQQHCLFPQPPHNTTTPIVWYR